MATVELRDIVTDADREAVLRLRRGPGQERFLGSMESHFEDAVEDARARPRLWSVHDGDALVGFVMISDGIPAEVLAGDDDLIGPFYLWRLLIDEAFQRQGYGAAAIDAVADYLRTRPGADVLWTSCGQGDGSPQSFYERYGFVATGDIKWDEVVLRLDLPRHVKEERMSTIPDAAKPAGARALERLDLELIGWLTTTNPDGQPQSSPIWFLWVGEEILIYSGKRAPRNDNVAERPLVAFTLNTDAGGGDVVIMEGEARVDLTYAPADAMPAYLAKYRGLLDAYEWTPEYFAAEYPLPILVRPTRWRLG